MSDEQPRRRAARAADPDPEFGPSNETEQNPPSGGYRHATHAAIPTPASDERLEVTSEPAETTDKDPKEPAERPRKLLISSRVSRHLAPVLEALLAVLVLLGGSFGAFELFGEDPEPAAPVQSSTEVSVVCPGFSSLPGSIVGYAGAFGGNPTGSVSIATIGSAAASEVAVGELQLDSITEARLLQPEAGIPLTVGLGVGADGKYAATACGQPMTNQYLQFSSTEGSTLRLTNPDEADVIYNVTVFGPDGVIGIDSLRDLTISPRATIDLPLGQWVQGAGVVGVRIQTTTGRIAAIGLTDTEAGLDLVTAAQTGTQLLVPGIPNGAEQTQLILTNPNTTRTSITVSALGANGRFDIVGATDITIEAGQTRTVALGEVLKGEASGLLINAERGVVASALVRQGPDIATVAGVPGEQLTAHSRTGALNAPSQLILSNSAEQAVQVQYATKTSDAYHSGRVTLQAGATVSVELDPGALLVQVWTPQGVMAAVASYPGGDSAGGISILGLTRGFAELGDTPIQVVAQPR